MTNVPTCVPYLLLTGVIAFTGCGGKAPARSVGTLVPVKGKVMLGDKPFAGGSVTLYPLEPKGALPIMEGAVDEQGQYSIKTFDKEGAPVGKYRVCLETGGMEQSRLIQFDPKYAHRDNSPLVIDVTAGTSIYDLQIEPRRNR